MRLSLEEYALRLAATAALRCEDPYLQVGSCILRDDGSVASMGYNGPPPGINIDWSNRDSRRGRVVHAEANALRFIQPGEGYLLASTHCPCEECIKLIRSYGIYEVVYLDPLQGPQYSMEDIEALAEEFGMNLVHAPDEL